MWTITDDKIDGGKLNGMVGPRSATLTADEIANHPNGRKFRVRDDDGETYWYGVWIGDDGTEDMFQPLDNFGESYGATEIQYKRANGWETL